MLFRSPGRTLAAESCLPCKVRTPVPPPGRTLPAESCLPCKVRTPVPPPGRTLAAESCLPCKVRTPVPPPGRTLPAESCLPCKVRTPVPIRDLKTRPAQLNYGFELTLENPHNPASGRPPPPPPPQPRTTKRRRPCGFGMLHVPDGQSAGTSSYAIGAVLRLPMGSIRGKATPSGSQTFPPCAS